MSAYSASRHLAVELASFGPELQSFATAAAACTRARERTGAADLNTLADRLEEASDPRDIGATVCELLESLRGDPDAAAAGLRREIRSLLRRIADREVDLLADLIEAPKP